MIRPAMLLAVAGAALAPAVVQAQAMPGMVMPAHPQPSPAASDQPSPSGTALPAGDAPAPPPPADHYADRFFPAADSDRAHERMMAEEGGRSLHRILFNLAEYQVRDGHDGYRWDGEGWFGGDIDRLVVKSEGEGTLRHGIDAAEVQALWSHAIGPYFDLQGGVRQDVRPTPARSYATLGFEGLAPYRIETEAALFLSTHGELLARIEGWYDQRITQRLLLQLRIELNLSAQDVRATRIGAGLSDAELGLRLRYEIGRRFAPYVGISYEAKTGRTADYARADGRDATSTSLVAGAHLWF